MRVPVAASLCLALMTSSAVSRADNDPSLQWRTIESPHFRVTYYSGEREIAEHVADVGEAMLETLATELGWKTSERTEILLTDQTDNANGFAAAVPYNAIRLYVTAPDDLSPLGDVDDWYLELLTHEYTHILHVDHIRGVPSLVNALLGKTWAPNQVQPRWLLEGLAVLQESKHTSGGRMRSALWDMYMRADVLEDNVATLDQFSNSVRRWPQGNLWYLYGSQFLTFISETYGAGAIRKMIDDYSGQIVPWGINRSIRRATGKTFEELYPLWVARMRTRYTAQRNAITQEGIVEGRRLTFAGQSALYPRWIPKGAWEGTEGSLIYQRDDGHERQGLYALPVVRNESGRVTKAGPATLMIRTSGDSPAAFTPDGGLVMASQDGYRDIFSFSDLHAYPKGERSVSGHEGIRKRLTEGFRAHDPDVSRDGRQVVFVSNHRGTRYLQIADIVGTEVRNVRPLVKSERWEQVFTPRFSPDGQHVVASAWTAGGYRDIRYIDVKTGAITEVMRDRAVDGGCSFSPDGKQIYFHSDRTGVFNVYAWDVSTATLSQVTNVVSGAFYPEVSPDGKTLAYIGYSKDGFDVFAMPISPAAFRAAKPYVDNRPSMPRVKRRHYEPVDYNPLSTLAPRKFSVQLTQGSYGQVGILTLLGSDIATLHAVSATVISEFEKPAIQGNIAYSYRRLPFDVTLTGYRSISPRAVRFGTTTDTRIDAETVGVDTGISYSKLRMFDSQNYALGYSVARTGALREIPANRYDPYETPGYPGTGLGGILRAGYSYSNAEGYLRSVSSERGFSFGLDVNVANPALGSQFTGYASTANLTTYHLMPWLSHHVLALHAGGGTSGGGYPGKGIFYVGSFVDLPVLDVIRNVLVQGGVVLRGYPPAVLTGNYYALLNAEYRFPIVNLDRGISTLPVFLNRINGNFFFDYGSAFESFRQAEYKSGVGGEAWFDFLLGYNLPLTFRLGYARGLASQGIDRVYTVAAVPY